MTVTGIIAEYNPLHFGHQFHIEQTKQAFSSKEEHYIITILSGDFVQRGLPSIIDKHTRTRMALEAGSDLVLELPVSYALSSGEGFAFGGVSLLHQLGCVDSISFGTEAGQLEQLLSIAKVLTNESPSYQSAYQATLKEGLTHPAAQHKALETAYPALDTTVLNGQSNNMLALEYCKALLRLQSPIKPMTIKRKGQHYLSQDISQSTDAASFASATAIRSALKDASEQAILSKQVPSFVLDMLTQAKQKQSLVYADDFSLLLHYKLLTSSREELLQHRGISPDLANKLVKYRNQFVSFTQFANLLWSKDTTYASVCRSLMYLILDIKQDFWDVHQKAPYARVLGFRKQSAPLLSQIKKSSSIPLVTKLANAPDVLPPNALNLLELDMQAAHIYDSVVQQKTHNHFIHESQKQLIIL